VPLEAVTDLLRLIAEQPPANPFLKIRWVEAGLLSQDEIQGAVTEYGEGERSSA
jgi:hypothetical protein